METTIGAPIAEGRTAEVFAWGDNQVLKLFRPGRGADAAALEAERARHLRFGGPVAAGRGRG